MSESNLEQKHRRIARLHGWLVAKIEKTSLRGFPDRFYARAQYGKDVCSLCNRGRIVLLEWKDGDKPATFQQLLRIQQLRHAGIEVHIVGSVEEANRVLGIEA